MKKLAMLQQKHLYLRPYICLDNKLNSSVHEKLLILGKSWANFFTQYTNIDKVEIFHVLQPSLFHKKIPASVANGSHQDRGPCFLHFFLINILPFSAEK